MVVIQHTVVQHAVVQLTFFRKTVNLLLGIDHVEAGYQCDAKLGFVGIRKWTRIRVDKVRLKLEMTQVGC